MQERLKGFIAGSVVGSIGGVLLGGTLAALFWNDVAAGIRRMVRRLTKSDDEINFEVLLQ